MEGKGMAESRRERKREQEGRGKEQRGNRRQREREKKEREGKEIIATAINIKTFHFTVEKWPEKLLGLS